MKKKSKRSTSSPWFMKGSWGCKGDWDWIPLNWKGWVALFTLVFLNIFSAQYFNLVEVYLEGVLSFLTVFLISIFVFVMVAKQKTKG